jgi:hypothetical protein
VFGVQPPQSPKGEVGTSEIIECLYLIKKKVFKPSNIPNLLNVLNVLNLINLYF